MVAELLSSYCGAHLVESNCKELNNSDTNWLRYLYSSYLKKIWLSVWRHHLANLHILKNSTSLEQKEIFEKSKWRFSSHAVYLFMFKNGLDWKDAIFVIVPLYGDLMSLATSSRTPFQTLFRPGFLAFEGLWPLGSRGGFWCQHPVTLEVLQS